MKILKTILLSLLIAASMSAVSTSVLAETDKGRITYEPADAIDITISKIKIALDAVTSGTEGEKVSALIKEATDSTKEINANDKVDMARSRAIGVLKTARAHAKEAALQEVEQELRNAMKMFSEMKSLL